VKELPASSKRSVRFKISDNVHEYNCVRNAFLRAGFKRVSGWSWNICWAKHLREEEFLRMTPFQKVNHFPGTWGIGRKDRLAHNLSRMRREFGQEYAFSARTFFLPKERAKLKMQMDADPKSIWILKPAASSCGRGIKLVSGLAGSKLPKKRKVLAQNYIRSPFLINGHKWDLRLYVLVTSFDPLRVYLFDNGLTRFCTEKYTLSHKTLKNRFAHLTNYSVNKHSEKFLKNESANDDMYVLSPQSSRLRALLVVFLNDGPI